MTDSDFARNLVEQVWNLLLFSMASGYRGVLISDRARDDDISLFIIATSMLLDERERLLCPIPILPAFDDTGGKRYSKQGGNVF